MGVPFLEAFKPRLDRALGSPIWWVAALAVQGFGAGWTLRSIQPKPFCDPVVMKQTLVNIRAHLDTGH